MHFNIGDEVDFYEISDKKNITVKKLRHGIVTLWDEMGFGFAKLPDGRSIAFGTGNVVKHRWKDPDEVSAFTVWQGDKPSHFHHKANALKISPNVRHSKYGLSVFTEEERNNFFSD
jgi:hypothetical protein